MIGWEIKKLIKSKGLIISLGILSFILAITVFIKPVLETENRYIDENKGIVEDTRDKLEIANEKFEIKLETLEGASSIKENDEFSKKISSMSKEKIDNLKNKQYENVGFWQVFTYRATNPLINIGMLIIIMIIISNLYTDEIISSVKDIILSSKEKKSALNSKIIIAFLIPVITYLVYLSGAFVITYIQQGAPVNGNLEAFRIVNNVAILKDNISIFNYTLRNIGVALLMFEGWAMVSMACSFVSTSSIASISSFGLFIALTKIISVIKFLPAAIGSVLSYSNYYDLIFNFNSTIGNYLGNVKILGCNIDIINLSIGIFAVVLLIAVGTCFGITRSKYINR